MTILKHSRAAVSEYSARGRSSKQKGAKAENEVAKLVEAWLRKEHPTVVVRRTPLSGGWSAAGEFAMRGDVQVRGAAFQWIVEVKRREGWSFRRFILGAQDSPVWGWWAAVCAEAMKAELAPMLWVRQSNMDWIIIIERDFAATRPRAPMYDYHLGEDTVGYTLRKFLATSPGDWR